MPWPSGSRGEGNETGSGVSAACLQFGSVDSERQLSILLNRTGPFWSGFSVTIINPPQNGKWSLREIFFKSILMALQGGTTQVFINGWLDKQNVVHAYSGVLFIFKKEK